MLKLVIVEDEDNIRECLENLFPWNSLGFTVAASFSNGQDAFHYLSCHKADLLLSDIRLPGISGLDLVRMLREDKNPIAVIILTGYRHFDYAQKAIRYKVHDFLLKPIRYEELTAAVIRIRDSVEAEPAKESADEEYAQDTGKHDGNWHSRIIAAAQEYVLANISEASLDATAVAVHLSPGYLSRLFHRTTGMTFSDYLIQCRMQKAAELLNNIEFKTYEVALMVGYDNPKNFTRAFKQYFKMTPREFRDNRSHRKDVDDL